MCVVCSVQSYGVLGITPYTIGFFPYVTKKISLLFSRISHSKSAEEAIHPSKVFTSGSSYNLFTIFVWFLIILNVLPFIAPMAASFGWYWISEPIYFVYSFMCHQFHWRSLHINNHQVAWCTRDTFIWGSFLAVTLAVKHGFITKGLKWYWLIPFTIPIALDGGIQTIATMVGFNFNEQFYLSTNLMRMITGSIFGIGLGVVISTFLKEEQDRIDL
ncbi:DUF2085 domain-containing protein [Candidatus Dojkabacteria bacterium]|uniref:DUF2085 domain-containing protein n=1 Tax=Candidatus Dojkabacteria bacterium TaxID=2099670 RepID=A0A955L7V7_9BACT|nr:DUF2085 domain-containing protein [Candidatus Dojkabacteria bacterium]